MGKISGCISATCKECGSRFVWHISHFPFTDAEIIGTCDDCSEKVDHNIIDEYQGLSGEIIGRKVFEKEANDGKN